MDALMRRADSCIPSRVDAGYGHLWEFRVGEGHQAQFEQYYGPEGPWVQLFRNGAGYRKTLLMRDLGQPRRYLTLDIWESAEAYLAFRQQYAAQYAALDRLCADFTLRETPLGELVVC